MKEEYRQILSTLGVSVLMGIPGPKNWNSCPLDNECEAYERYGNPIRVQVIALSGITLFGSLTGFVNTNPPMGGMGHFAHGFASVMVPLSVWGLATGFGLKRAWRWAWISMRVFGAFWRPLVPSWLCPFCSCLEEGSRGGLS